MVNEAEEFAEQDRVAKERIDARNAFESYLYSMRNTIDDPEKLANKVSEEDKDRIREAIRDGQSWLDANLNAEKEDFEEKMREVQKYYLFLLSSNSLFVCFKIVFATRSSRKSMPKLEEITLEKMNSLTTFKPT